MGKTRGRWQNVRTHSLTCSVVGVGGVGRRGRRRCTWRRREGTRRRCRCGKPHDTIVTSQYTFVRSCMHTLVVAERTQRC